MNPELQKLVEQAQIGIKGGMVTPEQADRIMQQQTGGRFQSVTEAEQALRLATAAERGERSGAWSRFKGHVADEFKESAEGFGDGVRMLAQGASLGFADELAGAGAAVARGGRGYREGRDASRANLERIRDERGLEAHLMEAAGGLGLPGGAVGSGVRGTRAAVGAARAGRIGRAAAAGAAPGAGFGAVAGAGNAAELSDIPQSALGGAVGGAVVGGGLGAAGAALQRLRAVQAVRGATSDQLADDLASAAGLPGGRTQPLRDAARARTQRVQQELYGPLDDLHSAIDDPTVLDMLVQNDRIRPIAKDILGKADMQSTPPSLSQLQSIRTGLRKAADSNAISKHEQGQLRRAADELSEAMQGAIPGLADADAAYATARAAESAFDLGAKLWTKSPEVIQGALAKLPDDQARAAFRVGALQREYTRLSRRGGAVTRSDLDRLLASGNAERLAELFESPAQWQAFRARIERRGRATLDAQRLEKLRSGVLKAVAIGAGAAVAGAAGGAAGFRLARSLPFE